MTTAEQVFTVERLDPRELVAHPRNVRTALGDLEGLTASIREQGVLEPLVVVPSDGRHVILAGHRRAAAAIAAELDRVPCVVRFDLGLDSEPDASAAVQIAAMLAENLHRENLTAVEEARGVQAMLDLGVPISKVGKATGLPAKRVKKALGVARLDESTAAAVTEKQLDLDQAAAVALFADEPNTAAKLVEAAQHGPGQFAHALERAKQARDAQRRYLERRAQLLEAGRTIVESRRFSGAKDRDIGALKQGGKYLTAQSHASCPGSATYLALDWGQLVEQEVCTDFAKHGHVDSYAASGNGQKAKPETAEEKDAAREERRKVIENNKAMAAANTVRRAWIKHFLSRRSAPAEVLRYSVEFVAAQPRTLEHWLSGSVYGGDSDSAATAMGLSRPSQYRQTEESLTSGEHVTDGRLPLQLFAHIAAAMEASIAKDSWRKGDHRADEVSGWLRFLAGQGYTLSDVEQEIVDGAAQ